MWKVTVVYRPDGKELRTTITSEYDNFQDAMELLEVVTKDARVRRIGVTYTPYKYHA